ncbi:HSP18 transcriptional regulator [Actinokineospora sp. G85]|uniref:HSP18 transcriptional regulator n=1 Tax=Actinokineospora sp. G85 TaxID=3406626 RepID=UPI003C7893C0
MLRGVLRALDKARAGTAEAGSLLAALTALRELRDRMAAWEPELIGAARAAGASWAALAPALGVTSRQAAERRYLRLQPTGGDETTGEQRVHTRRDQRAGDRAVSKWAQDNARTLRTLAAHIHGLDGLDAAAREQADRIGTALGDNDPERLLQPLSEARSHLADRQDLVDRLDSITELTDTVRQEAADSRRAGKPAR